MEFEPNVENLIDVITRRKVPDRIPNFEQYYNTKTVSMITGRPFPEKPYDSKEKCRAVIGTLIEYQLAIKCDFVPISTAGPYLPMKRAEVTPNPSRRDYLTQLDIPTIVTRDDYEQYPWPEEAKSGLSPRDRMMIETATEMVPPGMGILISHGGIYELMNMLTGYENFCYLLADDPELIDELADRLGAINLKILTEAAEYDCIDIFNMGDDIAYKGGTLVAPELLRRWVFPWMKKYIEVAHSSGKCFTLHSDGNFKAVAEDIVQAGVDGKQAFEDSCYKVTDFKRDYGDRISVLGGIDVDVLARLSEDQVRAHVRHVLEVCAPGGGYATGSGNCFTTYIPVRNYMAMLDEAELYSSACSTGR